MHANDNLATHVQPALKPKEPHVTGSWGGIFLFVCLFVYLGGWGLLKGSNPQGLL